MKYNLSEIMKAAWKMVKNSSEKLPMKIGQALKIAWANAKEKRAMETREKFEDYAEMNGFTFSRWEKYGKHRIYINNCTGRNKSNNGGFIDLDRNNSIVASGCVKFAAMAFLRAYIVA